MFIHPGGEEFLKSMSELYDIYVCTCGIEQCGLEIVTGSDI